MSIDQSHPSTTSDFLLSFHEGEPLDAYVDFLQGLWDSQQKAKKAYGSAWRRTHGRDFEQWRPAVGDSKEMLCVGEHYGMDVQGRRWRLPEAKDIKEAFAGMSSAWFRVTRLADYGYVDKEREKTKEAPKNTGNEPSIQNARPKRPHRRTGRRPTGRPVRLHFRVEHILPPRSQWGLPAREGRRDLTVYRFVRELHDSKFTEAEALAEALDLASRCAPPFDEEEVHRKVHRAYHPEPMDSATKAALKATKREPSANIPVRFRPVMPLRQYLSEFGSVTDPTLLHYLLARWILDVFIGRRDRYAYYGWNPKKKAWQPKPTRVAGLNESVVLDHLEGAAKGLYLVGQDGTTSLLVFDIDAHQRSKEEALAEVQRVVRELRAAGAEFGRNFVVEDSGGGFHVWTFIEAMPAEAAGCWGKGLLTRLGLNLDPEYRSVIPSGGVGPKGLGPLVRLPLGIHPKRRTRSCFLEAEEVLA